MRLRTHPTDNLPFLPRAFVFDVEGTLIDNVLPTLQCWSEMLAEFGITATVADLHPYLGMDGKQMLRRLLNKNDPKLLDQIVKLQGERYQEHYLPHVRPFPGLRRRLTIKKDADRRIALATSCEKDELAHYRAVMNIDDLIDVACCGDDVRREKPNPDIVSLALKKLRTTAEQSAMIGDTPYDSEASNGAGALPIGLQTVHFSRSDLTDAGCAAVFFDLQALAHKLEEMVPIRPSGSEAQPESTAPLH
jgi:phosphoglycolate phosphatase-like HAD superfamily hydrolase